MNRAEAAARVADASNGTLSLQDLRDGWPAIGELKDESGAVAVALYVGVIGESHRGRDSAERRFQNPGKDRPIEYSAERHPILIGLVTDGAQPDDLLVGFDPQRRLGKRTRYSMFVPVELIESGWEHGWTVGLNTTGEALVAFPPKDLGRYYQFRYADATPDEGEERDMSEVKQLLTDLVALLGLDTIAELGMRLAAELAGPPTEDPEEIAALLSSLAAREKLLEGSGLTWPSAMGAAAVLDDRIDLMFSLWDELSPSAPIPRSHEAFVRRIYEDPRFLGLEVDEGLETAVFKVARCCEPDLDEDDQEVFFADGAPTLFFYESVRSHIEADRTQPQVEEEDEEGRAEDDEAEERTQPVKAIVDKLQVIQVFNNVTRERLDIEPPWQRKDVWSLKKKRELIKSLILGIPLPSIILHEKGGRMSIIDGKQRLTAIVQFLKNEWKLPTYPPSVGSPLHECSGAFYAKAGKKSLPDDLRTTLELRHIPALVFENVAESRLRQIFELYNVSGMKLNAAEIRNAVYQSNPIHQVIYVLAGEGDGRTDLGIGGPAAQKAFSERLRHIYPGSKKRYQGVDFLARYLGYSRAVQRPGSDQFRIPSTSAAINNFFDHRSSSEDPLAVAKEFVWVMDRAEQFFDLDGERLAFFVRNEKGQRQFNKLVATTSMVGARFLGELIKAGGVSEAEARAAAGAVASPPPEKQQRATIWDYQARVLLGLRDVLGVDVTGALNHEWKKFFEKMEYCLLPDEDED